MYDDLVKRLKSEADFPYNDNRNLLREAADVIEELSKTRWIPVTERLPEVEKDVLVAFPHNQAVAYILDDGRWEVVSGDGWSTDINIADGEKIPTHWMPLPKPPKEGE